MPTTKIFILTIADREGNIALPYSTHEKAEEKLDNYVRRWWTKEIDDPMPEDRKERIAQYFNQMSDAGFGDGEFYSLEEEELDQGYYEDWAEHCKEDEQPADLPSQNPGATLPESRNASEFSTLRHSNR